MVLTSASLSCRESDDPCDERRGRTGSKRILFRERESTPLAECARGRRPSPNDSGAGSFTEQPWGHSAIEDARGVSVSGCGRPPRERPVALYVARPPRRSRDVPSDRWGLGAPGIGRGHDRRAHRGDRRDARRSGQPTARLGARPRRHPPRRGARAPRASIDDVTSDVWLDTLSGTAAFNGLAVTLQRVDPPADTMAQDAGAPQRAVSRPATALPPR